MDKHSKPLTLQKSLLTIKVYSDIFIEYYDNQYQLRIE